MADIVRTGETGSLIDPDAGPKPYADAILSYLQDPDTRDRHASAARDLIIREHSFAATIRAWRLVADHP